MGTVLTRPDETILIRSRDLQNQRTKKARKGWMVLPARLRRHKSS